jgi:hypothetical protein
MMCDLVERAKFIYWNFDKMMSAGFMPQNHVLIWELYFKFANLFTLMDSKERGLTAENAINSLMQFSLELQQEYSIYYFNTQGNKLNFEEWVNKRQFLF